MLDYMRIYREWLDKAEDSEIAAELNNMRNNERLIADSFCKELSFGTGGLRGVLGAGTNCLNIYTVRKITRGLAAYLKSAGGKSACICYDSRIKSDLFARCVAQVFAQNGIKVYISKELMPTPFLSFATRHYKADAGVMITASHNPAQYNGYKVYGPDGCQITDAAAAAITAHIEKAECFGISPLSFIKRLKTGAIEYIADAVEIEYQNAVHKESVGDKLDAEITVAYTPLNGTGYRLVPEILKRIGVRPVFSVPEQNKPDGNFPTCPYPNPEKKEALALVIECAKKHNADLALATDPDADRVGIAVRHNENYVLMTGNEVGILLCDYILSVCNIQKPLIIKTIVTSILGEKVAKARGAEVIDVLTGFKYIGETIGELEKDGEAARFAFGFEESYGYLKGTYVRDKDAVVASMLICEMAAYYKKEGKTLKDAIDAIYARYGLYEHKLLTFEFAGAIGGEKMRKVLSAFRAKPPRKFAGISIAETTDYLNQTKFKLPKADVLRFDLADGGQIIIRPSGTEPLIKVYLTACIDKESNARFFECAGKELQGLLA